MVKDEKYELEQALEKILEIARGYNLDFYDMYFEICPADIIYTFGAYGMPTRFSHWSFGKAYHKMKTQYDYNLSRIYEMVINSDPCYAFLLEGNSLIQNKMVMAHVLAHCDFFKNNVHFGRTSRQMVESMSVSAQRIRKYEFLHGRDKVESFLDSVISIQEHIDPYRHIGKSEDTKEWTVTRGSCCGTGECGKEGCGSGNCGSGSCGSHSCGESCGYQHKSKPNVKQETPYDDLWDLDYLRKELEEQDESTKKFPQRPEKDILLFIMENARDLEDWQRDIISIIREEMFYFWPQMQTKIMNEGWATYWHLRIMRDLELNEDESLEFAKLHAGVIQTSKIQINPYYVGLKLFEDIERRWNEPTQEEKDKFGRAGGEGMEKIFEVRQLDNDVSFLRNYMTKEFVEKEDLYLYKKVGYEWKIVEKDWEKVRDGLVAGLINSGFPYIVVEDGDFGKRGELYLKHVYEGVELDVFYLERTLPHVFNLWGRPVHLETILDNKKVLFNYNGEKVSKKFIE